MGVVVWVVFESESGFDFDKSLAKWKSRCDHKSRRPRPKRQRDIQNRDLKKF